MMEQKDFPLLTEEDGKITLHMRICEPCKKYYDRLAWKIMSTPQTEGVTQGYHFGNFYLLCSRCGGKFELTKEQLALINTYTLDNPDNFLMPGAKPGGELLRLQRR